jgi:hypothetical protein
MKTGKKIAVGLAAALVVAMIAAGAVSMVGAYTAIELSYMVTVLPAFDISFVVINASFGQMLPGHTSCLTPSYTLTNVGVLDAQVGAAFTTGDGTTHGFTTSESVIPAKQLKINNIALNDDGSVERLDDAGAGETTEYNTELVVPGGQEAGDYSGTVELTFSAEIPEPIEE